MILKQNNKGKFAFVCYENPNDYQEGFRNAAEAKERLHQQKNGTYFDQKTQKQTDIKLDV